MITVRVLGGGWYGCHVAKMLSDFGCHVELHETRPQLFGGASGANPARLHLGFHYPRSQSTRRMCQANYARFMETYGKFTRGIPTNIYAVAQDDSMVDYANYLQVLGEEVEYVDIPFPEEVGLQNVEGAVLTGERHILVNAVRNYFTDELEGIVEYNTPPCPNEDNTWDLTIDCTFSCLTSVGVDRYEPCITHIYEGDYNKAVTIMDGPFPSIYPHYNENNVSLTSAKFTPIGKCSEYAEAKYLIDSLTAEDILDHKDNSAKLMEYYYPAFGEYFYLDSVMAVRAMPRSGADSRMWGTHKVKENHWAIRAGKIDAIFDVSDALLKEIERCF